MGIEQGDFSTEEAEERRPNMEATEERQAEIQENQEFIDKIKQEFPGLTELHQGLESTQQALIEGKEDGQELSYVIKRHIEETEKLLTPENISKFFQENRGPELQGIANTITRIKEINDEREALEVKKYLS